MRSIQNKKLQKYPHEGIRTCLDPQILPGFVFCFGSNGGTATEIQFQMEECSLTTDTWQNTAP
jgi:hypothetical protein